MQVIALLKICVQWPINSYTVLDYIEEAVSLRRTFAYIIGYSVGEVNAVKAKLDEKELNRRMGIDDENLFRNMAAFVIILSILLSMLAFYFVGYFL